jgi:hypothetical protein
MSVNPLYKLPAFAKIAIFLSVLAFAGILLRAFDALGRQQSMAQVFTWADAKYYLGVWAIFSTIYYLGWAIWRVMLKGKTKPTETLEIRSDKEE